MPGKVTFWFTLFALAVCAYHALGYDHSHIILLLFSIPAWIIAIFTSIQTVGTWLLYILTVASWAAIGLVADRIVLNRKRARQT